MKGKKEKKRKGYTGYSAATVGMT